MFSAASSPANTSAAAPDTALILCNLGTPTAPTAPAVRRYLAEFLSDRRVVDLPRALWLPILYGAVLPTRPAKSAAKYQSVWLDAGRGSPLMHYSLQQSAGVQARLGSSAKVYTAMRYGQPALGQVLSAAQAQGAKRIVLLPLYPQYSSTTTASIYDSLNLWCSQQRQLPSMSVLSDFATHPGYIAALAAQVQAHWQAHGRGQKLLLSFHGVPERTVRLGDPYALQCEQTAAALSAALGLAAHEWQMSYQSRFGKAKWLEPASDRTLQQLAAVGLKTVDVFCPGFVSDCLETLEEIAIEGAHIFRAAGGQSLNAIPCLNDSPAWLDALAEIAREQMGS